MKSQFRFLIAFCTAIVIAVFAMSASAQEFRGTITGTVTDPNGAVVPGAKVTVKNTATNIATNVVTNDSGVFTAPFLTPGAYSVSVVGDGFKTSTRENVEVKVDDRISLDFKLEIGAAAEVNIVADSDVLERGSVTTGTLISKRQIEELPLSEGAPYVLATQGPGIVYTGDPNFQGPTANGNLAGFRSNGTQGNQVNGSGGNVINLDGSPNLAYDGQVAFTPTSASTQEFKVQTNTFDAQMGFTAGAIVNVATKSGSNAWHGEAYWYNRDRSRTANNFFNNRAGLDRPERQYNRYGGMISGPIIKDKTFFLFAYENQKDNVAQTTTYSVPIAAWRTGDFSSLIVNPANIADAANTIIYNPFTGTQSGSNVVRQSFGCPASGAVPAGSQCNIIPQALMYQPALQFMQNFPLPNLPGTINNYITDQNLIRPYYSLMGRIDHNFSANTKIFGKWYKSHNTEDRYNLTMEPDSIFRGFEDRDNNGGNVNLTTALNPNMILDIRGSYGSFKLTRYQEDQPTAGDLGFTGIPVARQGNVFPRFDFTNAMTVGSQRADWNDGRVRPFDMFTFQPTFTQIWGNHTFKYGYDFRRLNETFDYQGYASGRFRFQGTYTMQASNSGGTQRDRPGRDLASFLLGIPVADSTSLIDNPQIYDVSSQFHGFFVHDDWRVNSKLTLNLGIRYEYETGYHEEQGRMVTDFNRDAASPIRAQALANYQASVPAGIPIDAFQNLSGGFVFASSPGAVNQRSDPNNWQPRLGFSYAFNDRTILRGGFGIFTAPFQIITQNVVFQPGYSSPTLFTPSTNNGLTFIATLANAFPTGIAPSPGSAQGLMTFVGRDLTAVGNSGPTSIVLQNERENANYTRFIIGIQREVFRDFVVEATYVYSAGSDLAVNRELNYIPRNCVRSDNSNPCLVDLATANPATLVADLASATTYLSNQLVANPFRGLVPDSPTWNASTIARRRLLTAFPQFGNVSVTEYDGSSTFHSFQVQATKRFSRGFSLNASYTFSDEKIKNQYLNPQDTELTEYISPNERPHRFTFSGIYELPFGKGRTWGSDWNGVVDAFLGGWQVQGIYEWQSGEPLIFQNVYYNGDPTQLKSQLGDKDEQGRRYGVDIPGWDISGFYLNGVQSAANTPGVANNYTSGSAISLRNFPLTVDGLRNQRFLKFDVGVSKNFRIKEGMKIQFRVDAINFLNTPYFSAPTTNPATLPTTTGGVTNPLGSFGFTNAPVRQPPRDIQIGARFTF